MPLAQLEIAVSLIASDRTLSLRRTWQGLRSLLFIIRQAIPDLSLTILLFALKQHREDIS